MLNEEIIRLIEEGAQDQAELLDKLKILGYEITQSSISRKLKALGIAKFNGQYRITQSKFNNKITFVPPNLIIINTLSGYAGAIATKIDELLVTKHPEFVSCIAGDDTIFIAINLGNKTSEWAINKTKVATNA